MHNNRQYDVAIVGGGLAGLAAAIQLAKAGKLVILFEKESYPFHKVCGEYIGMESWHFLERLGLDLSSMNLPIIKKLILTSPNGNTLHAGLTTGGFGLSRYTLDHLLVTIARANGVEVLEKARVNEIRFDEVFTLSYSHNGATNLVNATLCCGAFGKRSNLDVKWQRKFLLSGNRKLNNYVGIKYQVIADWPEGVIGLHNFYDGYCGISKIEDNKYCLCYLTTAENLKRSGNKIETMELTVLSQNPHLKKILQQAKRCEGFPVTISQISFDKKTAVENHVLCLGDAAGMITPLCGNGMSIAFHTSKLATECMLRFMNNEISRQEMERQYALSWNKQFAGRLKRGRWLQRFFGKKWLSNAFVHIVNLLPFMKKPLIRMTHGQPF